MRYNIEIRSLDAWHDEECGWFINDSFVVRELRELEMGEITARKIFRLLREEGLLSEHSKGKVKLDDDDLLPYYYRVIQRSNGMPLFSLYFEEVKPVFYTVDVYLVGSYKDEFGLWAIAREHFTMRFKHINRDDITPRKMLKMLREHQLLNVHSKGRVVWDERWWPTVHVYAKGNKQPIYKLYFKKEASDV